MTIPSSKINLRHEILTVQFSLYRKRKRDFCMIDNSYFKGLLQNTAICYNNLRTLSISKYGNTLLQFAVVLYDK